MYQKIIIAVSLVLLPGCLSLKDAGRAYFRGEHKYVGILSPAQVLERTEQHQKIRHIIYGQLTTAKIIQCTLLRNQLYVASLKGASGQDGKDLKYASTLLEQAYQLDDHAFLTACDQVLGLRVGRVFNTIQQQFLAQEY